MPVATCTLTGDLNALPIGHGIDAKGRVETNIPTGKALHDLTQGGKTHLGQWPFTVEPDGKFTVADLPRTDQAETNPTGFMYRVVIDYIDPASRKLKTWTSNWFPLTTATQDLKTVAGPVEVGPQWRPVNYDQLELAVADAMNVIDGGVL